LTFAEDSHLCTCLNKQWKWLHGTVIHLLNSPSSSKRCVWKAV